MRNWLFVALNVLYATICMTALGTLRCSTITMTVETYLTLDGDGASLRQAGITASAAFLRQCADDPWDAVCLQQNADAVLERLMPVSVLTSNPNIVCYESSHTPAAAVAWVLVFAYLLGYPIGTWAYLRATMVWAASHGPSRRLWREAVAYQRVRLQAAVSRWPWALRPLATAWFYVLEIVPDGQDGASCWASLRDRCKRRSAAATAAEAAAEAEDVGDGVDEGEGGAVGVAEDAPPAAAGAGAAITSGGGGGGGMDGVEEEEGAGATGGEAGAHAAVTVSAAVPAGTAAAGGPAVTVRSWPSAPRPALASSPAAAQLQQQQYVPPPGSVIDRDARIKAKGHIRTFVAMDMRPSVFYFLQLNLLLLLAVGLVTVVGGSPTTLTWAVVQFVLLAALLGGMLAADVWLQPFKRGETVAYVVEVYSLTLAILESLVNCINSAVRVSYGLTGSLEAEVTQGDSGAGPLTIESLPATPLTRFLLGLSYVTVAVAAGLLVAVVAAFVRVIWVGQRKGPRRRSSLALEALALYTGRRGSIA
jgi:hypothetical protein